MNHDLNHKLESTIAAPLDDLALQPRAAAFRSSLIVSLTTFALLAYGLFTTLPFENWMQVGAFIAISLIVIGAAISAVTNQSDYTLRSVYLMLALLWVGSLATVLLASGIGLVLAIGIFAITIGISVQALPVKVITPAILVGTFAGLAVYLLDLLIPYQRYSTSREFQVGMLVIFTPAILLFLFFLVQNYSRLPLFTKIVVPFVVVSLLSIGSLTAYNDNINRRSLMDAANQNLRASALQAAAEVDNYLLSITNPLRIEATLPAFVNFLSLPEAQRSGSIEEAAASSLLQYLQNRENILSYSLISRQGTVLLSTLASTPAELEKVTIFQDIERAQSGALAVALLTAEVYITPVIYDQANNPSLYFVMSISNADGTPVGFLVSQYSTRILQDDILVPLNDLAEVGSYAVLVSEDNVRLAQGNDPSLLDTLIGPVEQTVIQRLQAQGRLPKKPAENLAADDTGLSAGLSRIVSTTTTSMFVTTEGDKQAVYNAVAVPLRQRPWKVVYLQPQEILLEPVNAQLRTTSVFVVLIISIVILASGLIARVITRPVNSLADMANRISQGELDTRLPVTSQDEIGSLSGVFNNMTGQLQQILLELEQRVADRTRELAQATGQAQDRARQLEIIANISRVIATERDPDQLQRLVVRIISEQMGFYHVGIFLLDPQREYAVLQAANSVGGQHMLERGHRLRIGQQGIIGYVTSTGQPRVALDVGADAVFFNNPDLPETRSEIGLPLRSGDEIIGALDVQSTQPGAFTEADTSLLSSLADQVSIAIENARLFSEANQALTELQTLQRQYLREQWDKSIEKRRQVGFTYERGRVVPILSDGEEVIAGPGPSQRPGSLSIPISLRGEHIGTIDLSEFDRNRAWSAEELSLVNEVAQQIGLALENARLIEETQQRAERESLVSQITTRLRASNDPQEILQTAVAELRHALRARTAHIVVPVEDKNSVVDAQASMQNNGAKTQPDAALPSSEPGDDSSQPEDNGSGKTG